MIVDLRRDGIGAVVLDIEGTTTAVSFVYDVLFPYARQHLGEFLREEAATQVVARAIDRLHDEWLNDVSTGQQPPDWSANDDIESRITAATEYCEWLMDRDRKSPALKLLQGLIWKRGYDAGELRGEVFPDVAPALQRWSAAGIKVAIYSSGSVLAQRLLFGHTPYGDLNSNLAAYFDTGVGPKTSAHSYQQIASALGCRPYGVLFVSDSVAEIDAARTAGCRVLLCIRPGNSAQTPPPAVRGIRSLDEIVAG